MQRECAIAPRRPRTRCSGTSRSESIPRTCRFAPHRPRCPPLLFSGGCAIAPRDRAPALFAHVPAETGPPDVQLAPLPPKRSAVDARSPPTTARPRCSRTSPLKPDPRTCDWPQFTPQTFSGGRAIAPHDRAPPLFAHVPATDRTPGRAIGPNTPQDLVQRRARDRPPRPRAPAVRACPRCNRTPGHACYSPLPPRWSSVGRRSGGLGRR